MHIGDKINCRDVIKNIGNKGLEKYFDENDNYKLLGHIVQCRIVSIFQNRNRQNILIIM